MNPMRRLAHFQLCFLAAFMTTSPPSPEFCLKEAKTQPTLGNKISDLRRCIQDFPRDPGGRAVRDQLVSLLIASNRYEEALQTYRFQISLRKPTGEPDLKLLELLLKTGRFTDVDRLTAGAPRNGHDFLFDERLVEYRVQALLAQGHYGNARQALDQWLGIHEREGLNSSRFMPDVRNLQQLRRSLFTLERTQGATGKALFTASVSDSLNHWSRRRQVPVVFFKLVPTDSASQLIGSSIHTDQTSPAPMVKAVGDRRGEIGRAHV